MGSDKIKIRALAMLKLLFNYNLIMLPLYYIIYLVYCINYQTFNISVITLGISSILQIVLCKISFLSKPSNPE